MLIPGFVCELLTVLGFDGGGVYVPCIYRMAGGVIVGDSGLCCCVPVQCVASIVFECNDYFPLFVDGTERVKLDFRPFSPLHTFSATPLFGRYTNGSNTVLAN